MARLIAIDPGGWQVKVTALSGTDPEATVEGLWTQRVPHMEGERPTVADRLAALDLLLDRHPELTSGAHLSVVGWPMDRASLRSLALPFDNDEQIAQTLPFALEAEVPFDLEEMHLAWRRLAGGRLQVCLLPAGELRELLEGLAERGLDPKIALTEADALARLASEPGEVVAVVDLGDTHSTVTLARERAVIAARAVSSGVADAVAAVVDTLDCSPREARILLGDDPPDLDRAVVDADEDDDEDTGSFELAGMDGEDDAAAEAELAFEDGERWSEDGADPAFDVVDVDASVDEPTEVVSWQDAPAPLPRRSGAAATAVPEEEAEETAATAIPDEPGIEPTDGEGADEDATDPDVEVPAVPESTYDGPVVRGQLPQAAQAAVDDVLTLWIAEVRAALVALEDDAEVGTDALILTGGGALLPGLAEALSEDLGLEVRPFGDGLPEEAVSRQLAWALHDGDRVVVDLRSGDLAFRGGLDLPRAIMGYGSVALSLFVLVMLVGFTYQWWTIQRRIAQYDDSTLKLVSEVLDLPSTADARMAADLLGDEVFDNRELIEFLGDVDEAPPMMELLLQITQGFPPHPQVQVTVDSLDISGKQIQIKGQTEGYAQVDRIGASLEESGRFGSVQAEGGNRARDGGLGFTVTASRDPSGTGDL